MKRKRKSLSHKLDSTIDSTSSLNKYFMCECGKQYVVKSTLIKHVKNCDGTIYSLICRWCNVTFTNRGNLCLHALKIHGDSSYQAFNKDTQISCAACGAYYNAQWKLRYHIRRKHFNLLASKMPYELKEVNQVWFERVKNSTAYVEIRKTGVNTLVMRPKLQTQAVIEELKEQEDLRHVYPTGPYRSDVVCKICYKLFRKIDLPKHMNERHYNIVKHQCNNCNLTFKRSYLYFKHVCHKGRGKCARPVGVEEYAIKIASVDSLRKSTPVVID